MADDKRLAPHIQRVTAELNNAPDRESILASAKETVEPHVANAILDQGSRSGKLTVHLARHPEKLQEVNSLSEKAARSRISEMGEQLENGGDLKDWIRIRDDQERIRRGRR